MDKHMIIDMLIKKDSKRKKKLYDFFRSVFDQQFSVAMTAELINCELGSDLVTAYDVKYIRARIAKKTKGHSTKTPPKADIRSTAVPTPGFSDASSESWPDPDKVKTEHFQSSILKKQ